MASELNWRRRWIADIRAMSWRSVEIEGGVYLMKTLFKEDSYTFMLSDLTSVWMENVDSTGIKDRIAALNPNLEAPVTKIIDHIQSRLTEPNTQTTRPCLKFSATPTSVSNQIDVQLTSTLLGIPFIWKFSATLSSPDVLCDHLTLPMLTMVSEMSRRHRELIRRLQAKDREIADYRSQGAKTSRKHLETPPFNEISFVNEMDTSKDLDIIVKTQGMTSFTPPVCDLYTTLMTKYAWLTHKDDSDEDERYSDETPGEAATVTTTQSWGNRIPPSFSLPRKSTSPRKSLETSPSKSPRGTTNVELNEDAELTRRYALNRKLAEKDDKIPAASKRRKKKINF